jgi:SAM-dependent methyltransferase
MKKITTPADLMETVNAFRMSRMILTAFELGIFDRLSGRSISSSALAGILGTDPRTTNRLLNALSGTGLVEAKNGSFSNSPFSEKFLVRNAPSFLGGMGHSLSMWKTWNTLTDAVKEGHAVADIVQNDINHRGESWIEPFIAAMHDRGVAQGKELASMLDLSGTIRTLDVGGGSGAFTFAFIEKNPAITGVIFDLPNVVPVTQKYIDRAGYTGTVTTIRGDYLHDDLGNGFDLVLMSAIIHINNPAENSLLISKGANALKAGGQLVIIDHVMNDDRTEPFAGAMFTLNMVTGTKHGDTYTERELRGWMQDAGLEEIRLLTAPSGMQVMIGIKMQVF